LIQVYTGSGKGKTTAALGLALRAAGAGLKVYFCQFLKGRYSCESLSLKKIKNITVRRFGARNFIKKAPGKKDMGLARQGLTAIKKAVREKKYDLIILDEACVALSLKLIPLKDILGVIKKIPKNKELIITGRNAPPEILKCADLVSDIKEVKHYFSKGIQARKGIEY
jgi:cob(I)alamin adenosyltransferase